MSVMICCHFAACQGARNFVLKGSRKNGFVATVSTWAFNVASHGCRDLLIYCGSRDNERPTSNSAGSIVLVSLPGYIRARFSSESGPLSVGSAFYRLTEGKSVRADQ
jgi:hypothetical protein